MSLKLIWKKMKNLNPFKKEEKIKLGKVAVIQPTENGIDLGLTDKFNKNIIIYENVEMEGNKIKWGKIIEEMPYTEEEALNLLKIKEIPVIERTFSNDFEFNQEPPFGEIITW